MKPSARDTPHRARKQPLACGYECSRCNKLLPSPEAGSAHLEKKHASEGFLTWQDYRGGEHDQA